MLERTRQSASMSSTVLGRRKEACVSVAAQPHLEDHVDVGAQHVGRVGEVNRGGPVVAVST